MNTQTFNISLPHELVKRVDREAKKEYKNRSEFIREALRIYIIRSEEQNQIHASLRKITKKADRREKVCNER